MSVARSTDDSEEEATENTRLMSETVAMENRAFNGDHGDGYSAAERRGDGSQPAVIETSVETVS